MSINPSYFSNLTSDLNSTINSVHGSEQAVCTAIQNFETEVMTELQSAINGIRSQIEALTPMVTIPTDLGSCITWITNAAQPYIKALAAAEEDLAQALAAAASLETAILNAAANLTTITCTITPTPVT